MLLLSWLALPKSAMNYRIYTYRIYLHSTWRNTRKLKWIYNEYNLLDKTSRRKSLSSEDDKGLSFIYNENFTNRFFWNLLCLEMKKSINKIFWNWLSCQGLYTLFWIIKYHVYTGNQGIYDKLDQIQYFCKINYYNLSLRTN